MKCAEDDWNLENFEWTSHVGNLENVESFSNFRKEKWKTLRGETL